MHVELQKLSPSNSKSDILREEVQWAMKGFSACSSMGFSQGMDLDLGMVEFKQNLQSTSCQTRESLQERLKLKDRIKGRFTEPAVEDLKFRERQDLSIGQNLKIQRSESFVNTVSQGTLGATISYKTPRTGSVLNGGTIGTTIGEKGNKGLFDRREKTVGLTFSKGSTKLKLDKEKKNRFSPLCCALLLGIFPLVSMAASDTITNSTSMGNITNNGSLTSIINKASGTIVGDVLNFSGGFTLSNSGMIGGSILNSSTGDVHVINSSSGSIVGGMRNYRTGTLNVTNYGRIGGVGSTQDSFASQNGVAVLTNYAGGVIEGILRSLVTGVLDVTNQGTFTQSVALQGSKASTIRNDSGGVIVGVVWVLRSAGSQSIDNAGFIQGNVNNMSPSVVSFTNSGTIVTGVINSGSGAVNATNSGVIGAANKSTANVFVTKSGSATLENSGTVYGNLNAQGGSVYLTSNTGTITGSILNGSGGTISINNNPNGLIRGVVRNGAINSNNNGTATVNNQGTILGGVGSSSGVLNVTNSGVIGTRSSLNAEVFVAEARARATLVNTGTIYGSFRASSGSTISLNQNSGTIVGSIANYSSGVNSITNSIDGLIQGTISNDDIGFTTIYNVGSITGTVGNTNARGRLSLNNTGNITGNINNGGTATLNNSGTIRGTVSNTGSGTFNISSTDGTITNVSNSGRGFNLSSTGGTIVNITNAGAAAFVTNTGGIITSVNNTGAGILTINSNSGTISSITNSGSSVSISNRAGATVDSINNQSGTATLNNQGFMGNIRNAGILASFTNSGMILGSLDNQAGGVISSNINNTDSAFIGGGIKNAGIITGTITNSHSNFSITNSGSLSGVNNTNGILNLTTSGGVITQINNASTGTLNLNSSGGTVASISNIGSPSTITNNGGNINNITNASAGTLNLDSNRGTISSIINNGGSLVTIVSSGTGSIGSIDNQNGTVSLTHNGGRTDSISNSSNGTLNVNSTGGTIASISNAGILATITNSATGNIGNISNTNTLSVNSTGGTITTIINSGTSITITNSGTGSIRNISNRSGTATLSNNAKGNIASVFNSIGATLTFNGTNAGIIGSINNLGTMSALTNSGSIALLNNQYRISGDVNNILNAVATIDNEGTVEGQVTTSGSARVTVLNGGVVTGGIKASDSSSISVISEEGSLLRSVYNEGSGSIALLGLTALERTIGTGGAAPSYDITNNGQGSVYVENLLVDLEPYTQSYMQRGNFSEAYANRVSLGGSNLNAIDIKNITVDLTQDIPLDTFLAQTVNVSQFVDGVFGDNDRKAHDCSGTDEANCKIETTEDGDVKKAYFGGTLINGLRDNVGDENFIRIRGGHSFDIVLADQHGNFNVVAKPEDSGAAQLDKVLFSSARERSSFVNNIVTSSIAGLNYYFKHSINHGEYRSEDSLYDANELYAGLTSDLPVNPNLGNISRQNSLYFKDSAVFILPYFSSKFTRLGNGDIAKGHNKGFIAGYTGITEDDIFYSIYGGYEDMDSKSSFYDMKSDALYTGFKIFNSLKRLGDNTELFVQYDGALARIRNSIVNNDGGSMKPANPKSYTWSLGTDLGVNYSRGKNIFTPQFGLGYDGSVIDAYKLDVPFERTRFDTYHTRVRFAWARDWTPHLQTVVEGGVKYYFNSNIKLSYELLGNNIEGNVKLSQWSKFVGAHFVVPLNKSFYFKLSYNGDFSKDGRAHTGFARFNYLF